MTCPKLTISIVAFNSDDVIEGCLNSVGSGPVENRPKIFVIDNASPDSSALKARQFPCVEVIESNRNLGFAGGHNLCWERIDTDYWLLLNPDVIITREQTDQLVRWMDEHPDVALATPALSDRNGDSLLAERRFPSIKLTLTLFLRLHLLMSEKAKAQRFAAGFADQVSDTVAADWIPGTVVIARRSAVAEVGPMSEDFFMYGEDVEWCWRFKNAGWKIGVANGIRVVHIGGTSTARSFESVERKARVERATFEVVSRMRGRLYARILAGLELLSSATEAFHPARRAEERADSRLRCRILSRLFLGRRPA